MSAGRDAVEDYLVRLPAGLESYPECRIKWSAAKEAIEVLPSLRDADLPTPILELIEHDPPPSEWIREVHFHACLLYAAYEFYDTDDAFAGLFVSSSLELFNQLAYRVMFRLVGPRSIIARVAGRWEAAHQGTVMRASGRTRRGGILHMDVPPYHCPELLARAYAGAVEAALLIAGGRDVEVEVAALSPTSNQYTCRWR